MPRRQSSRYSPPQHEPLLSRGQRRSRGVYYTPPEIAQLLAEKTLAPLRGRQPVRVLDPACGAGEFLVAARDFLTGKGKAASLFGIDIDPAAVVQARQRIGDEPCGRQILAGDALLGDVLPIGSFDAVIGNPPYVSIRELARSHSAGYVCELRERFQSARGNFDLYVLFIERALAWLREGGRCGLIIPNKWATLDYARPSRELLLKQATIEEVVDLSSQRVFREASVYPHLLIFTKRPPAPDASIRVDGLSRIRQGSLSADSFYLVDSLPVESKVQTQPLGSLARLACGTPGYAAAKLASRLVEATSAPATAVPFITSGNIDRYCVRTANVRYQGRQWIDPRLPLDADVLTPRQRLLFQSPKIVIAGLSRCLEAAWDGRGLALGVQVFAATDLQVDPVYLLALLNSKLLSYLFRTRFAAKRLGGGYLAVNKGQLAKLPIAVTRDGKSRRNCERLIALARSLSESPDVREAEGEIDRLVYRHYELTGQQIRDVEAHFAELATAPSTARAA
jgi:methylase of polypeptide subunit release factors